MSETNPFSARRNSLRRKLRNGKISRNAFATRSSGRSKQRVDFQNELAEKERAKRIAKIKKLNKKKKNAKNF